MLYVLVLIIQWNGPAITTVPFRYVTEASCIEAATRFKEESKNGYLAICLPLD